MTRPDLAVDPVLRIERAVARFADAAHTSAELAQENLALLSNRTTEAAYAPAGLAGVSVATTPNTSNFVLLDGIVAVVPGGGASSGVVAAPAAGANPAAYTVPAGGLTLGTVTTTVQTSAVAGNRIVALILKDPAGNLISETAGTTALAASSLLSTVTFLPGVALSSPSGGFFQGPLPPVTLAAGSTIQITTISGGIQAGDQYGPVIVAGVSGSAGGTLQLGSVTIPLVQAVTSMSGVKLLLAATDVRSVTPTAGGAVSLTVTGVQLSPRALVR